MRRQAAREFSWWQVFVAVVLCLGILDPAGQAAAQQILIEEADERQYQDFLKGSSLPVAKEWMASSGRPLFLQPRGGFAYCNIKGCTAPLCSSVTDKDALHPCTGEYSRELRPDVKLYGFPPGTKPTELVLQADELALRARKGSSIIDRPVSLHVGNTVYNTEAQANRLYKQWMQIKGLRHLVLVLSPKPLGSGSGAPATPWKAPDVSKTPPPAAKASFVTVKFPGLAQSQHLAPLFEGAAGHKEIVSCLKAATDGPLVSVSVKPSPGKDVVLDLTFDPAKIKSKPALFGTPLPCDAAGCGPAGDPVVVNIGVLKMTYPPGGKEDALIKTQGVKGVLKLPRNGHAVACRPDDSATYFLMRRVPGEVASFEEAIQKEHGLVIRDERSVEVPPKSTIAFSDSRLVIVVKAALPRRKLYSIFLETFLDSGERIAATEAAAYIGKARFSVGVEGAAPSSFKEATVFVSTAPKWLSVSEQIELEWKQKPAVKVPESLPGLKLTNLVIHPNDSEVNYRLDLPAAAVKPITVALETKRALYGKEKVANEYPGRGCPIKLRLGTHEPALEYREEHGGRVVLGLIDKQDAVPKILDVQRSLAASKAARLQISASSSVERDKDGAPCSGEFPVANLDLDARTGRLSGTVRLPQPKPIVLGLLAPQVTSSEFDPKLKHDADKLMLKIARTFRDVMDNTYFNDLPRWSTADIFAIGGGLVTEKEAGDLDLASRLVAGGMINKDKPGDLREVEGGDGALRRRVDRLAAFAEDFVAAVDAYRGLHGLAGGASEPKVIVIGLVSGRGNDAGCRRWVDGLDKLGSAVIVNLLIADDDPAGESREVKIVRCRGDHSSVSVQTFPLAAAVRRTEDVVLRQLALSALIGGWMRNSAR